MWAMAARCRRSSSHRRTDRRKHQTGGEFPACRVHLNLQDTPPSSAWMTCKQVGTWLSLVERTLGVGEVASSNLVVPTIYFSNLDSQIEQMGTSLGTKRSLFLTIVEFAMVAVLWDLTYDNAAIVS
jgi:hypothetical protein